MDRQWKKTSLHQYLTTFTYGINAYHCIKFTLICQRRKTLCLQWIYASVKERRLRWFYTDLLRSKYIQASWLQIWGTVTYLLQIFPRFAYKPKAVHFHVQFLSTICILCKKALIIIGRKCGNNLSTKQLILFQSLHTSKKTEQQHDDVSFALLTVPNFNLDLYLTTEMMVKLTEKEDSSLASVRTIILSRNITGKNKLKWQTFAKSWPLL